MTHLPRSASAGMRLATRRGNCSPFTRTPRLKPGMGQCNHLFNLQTRLVSQCGDPPLASNFASSSEPLAWIPRTMVRETATDVLAIQRAKGPAEIGPRKEIPIVGQ